MNILDTIVPVQIPYPIRSGIIRAVRTAVAILLAGLSASIADGSIIKDITLIPPAYTPAVLLLLSTVFTGVDKWLRERELVQQAEAANVDVKITAPTVEEPVNVIPDAADGQIDDVESVAVPTTDSAPAERPFDDEPLAFDDPIDDKV